MKAKLIVNPSAGAGAGAKFAAAIHRALRDAGLPSAMSESRAPGDIETQVREACQEGAEQILVAGGDGSIREAVTGIVDAGSDASLGVVPIGTGNDFARAAGLSLNWRRACMQLPQAQPRRIDVGQCNGHCFANGIGIGFDAESAIAARGIRYLPHRWIYAAGMLKTTARGIRTPRVTIEDDSGTREQRITLVAVCNGEYYGGGFHVTPRAHLDDGLLDVLIADPVSRIGVLRFAPRVIAGTHLSLPVISYHRAPKVKIESEEGLPVQADGEILYEDARSLEISILPGRLTLLG